MSRIVKINAEQSGPYTQSNNILDFSLNPAQYDNSRGFVNLEMEITQAITGAARGDAAGGIANYEFNWMQTDGTTPTDYPPHNAVLVKHSRLEVDGKYWEDHQRNDIRIIQQLNHAKNFDDVKSMDYANAFRTMDMASRRQGLGLELYSTGDKVSVSRNANIIIPLAHLFELGKLQRVPLDKSNNPKIHFELNLKQLGIRGTMTQEVAAAAPTAAETAAANLQFGDPSYRAFDNVTATAANQAVTSLTTTHRFLDLADSPYYVGMPILIRGTNGAAAFSKYATVTKITEDQTSAAGGKLTLEFNATIATIAAVGGQLTNVLAWGVNVDMSFECVSAELSLVEIPSVQVDELEYTTYEHEQDYGNELQYFNRQYYLPPECHNVYVCCPDVGTDTFCLIRQNGNTNVLNSFRLRVDQQDLTDRDVVERSSLYHEVASQVLSRSMLPYKNGFQQVPVLGTIMPGVMNSGAALRLMMIGGVVPLTPQRKTLDVAITSSTAAGVGNIHIFKEVVKKIEF